jgi:hypothetical protein
MKVGKTLTAESVAEWVGKPLIASSIGNLIVDESALSDGYLMNSEEY